MVSRGRRKSVGVVEMARDLGVSTATVSRALNGSPSVRRELADRIRAHAEARGYVANRLARALSASTSRAFVGFVIPYVDTPAYSAVAAECARLLSAAGTQMILAITEDDPEREFRQLRDLVGTRIAGLVISPSTHVLGETRRLLAELPVVELHRACGIRAPSVFSDDEQAMADSVLHLAGLGHTDVAYLGTPQEVSNGASRLRGIRRGLELAGLDPARMTLRLVPPTRENGYGAARDLLEGGARFSALVVGSGSLSVGAADAVRSSGRRLPDDLSLVVYGDPAWFVLADPPLTMVQVPYAELARRAAGLLLRALDAREAGLEPPAAGPHLVPGELHVAGSTAPPGGAGGDRYRGFVSAAFIPPASKELSVTDGALAGLRVIDAATLAAGPLIATWMGEQGAEVIKVEQPDGGDPLRQWGAQRDGIGLMWKSVARNKKSVTLNLRLEPGRDLLRSLTRRADVVIVNLRPSTMRKWSLDYGNLAVANPGLVMVHVTGYGAGGPKSDWPGFGTLGEAMSGFAHLTGTPDGPPTLPSFMLADGVAALTATYAVMMALYHRDTGAGAGQLIDINLIEPLARLLEQSVLTYDQLGTIPVRTGNRWDISAPRNAYKTKDGRWLAMSGSAPTIALRALRAVGRPELTLDPKFAEAQQRLRNAAEIDAIMADWISQRTLDAALAVFEEAGVAAAPIYDAQQLLDDPQLQARGAYRSIPDRELGSMRVQAPVPRFSATSSQITHLGPQLGQHNAEVYGELLGLDTGRLAELREQGVI